MVSSLLGGPGGFNLACWVGVVRCGGSALGLVQLQSCGGGSVGVRCCEAPLFWVPGGALFTTCLLQVCVAVQSGLLLLQRVSR